MEESEVTQNKKGVDALLDIISVLRGENGCPWDKKQTPQSMGVYLVEEVYELLEAIESGSSEAVCEELGDVLFQVMFIAILFSERGDFSLSDVVKSNVDKMVRRHPHVFGESKVDNDDDVRRQWRKIKKTESNNIEKESVLDSVPRKLPALMRAYRVAERAAGTGFDWDDEYGVMDKVEEEWAEFKAEVPEGNKEKIALEFGDVLFTMLNVVRFLRIHPETALSSATKKFEKRFRKMENDFAEKGREISSVSKKEMNASWGSIKKESGF
ncbi:MAG: nucleoside triphosphate pyrophosphohydrolase [Desulfobacterales bacterium]|nr:nucleoside triphosphate pyrophosphohydrolase [Desulfobacterales bacterium]